MQTWQRMCAYAGAALIFLSSVMHTLGGWPAVRGELQKVNASPDFTQGMAMAWHYGGMMMLVTSLTLFGMLRAPTRPGWLLPLFGGAYTAFGLWQAVVTGDAFTAVFILPGVLLLVAGLKPAQ